MAGFLIIAHAPLASALKAVAAHTFPESAGRVMALDVQPDHSPEQTEQLAAQALDAVRDPDALVFADVFGATPCNIAQRLAAAVDGGQVKVVAGVNVPMLWRTLAYAGEALDVLVSRAVTGASQGVMQVATSRPQNQSFKPAVHDSNDRHHQQ